MDTSTPTSSLDPTQETRRPYTVLVVDHRPEGASDAEAQAMGAEACDAFTRIHNRDHSVSIASTGSDGEPLSVHELFFHWEMLGRYIVSKADLAQAADLRLVRFLTAVLSQVRLQDVLKPSPPL
jgi:hypothetical protein